MWNISCFIFNVVSGMEILYCEYSSHLRIYHEERQGEYGKIGTK
jgi:hypothetical protein